jgi:hypothetical protein
MGKEVIKFVSADLLFCNACGQNIVYERDSNNPFKFWESHKQTTTHQEALNK